MFYLRRRDAPYLMSQVALETPRNANAGIKHAYILNCAS